MLHVELKRKRHACRRQRFPKKAGSLFANDTNLLARCIINYLCTSKFTSVIWPFQIERKWRSENLLLPIFKFH